MSIIYQIANKVNGKIYIGYSSKDPEVRFKEHCNDAKYKPKSSSLLHKAIRKYGKDSFIVTSIFASEDTEYTLNIMEPRLIKEYREQGYVLYNIQDGGGGNTNPARKKSVDIYNKNKELEITTLSISDAASWLGSQGPIVTMACQNARNNKGSQVRGYWVCFHGEQPVIKDQSHVIARNKLGGPWKGKKRPKHSIFMKEFKAKQKLVMCL